MRQSTGSLPLRCLCSQSSPTAPWSSWPWSSMRSSRTSARLSLPHFTRRRCPRSSSGTRSILVPTRMWDPCLLLSTLCSSSLVPPLSSRTWLVLRCLVTRFPCCLRLRLRFCHLVRFSAFSKHTVSAGMYFDDPESVPADKLRAHVGFITFDELTQDQEAVLAKLELKTRAFPLTMFTVSDFPIRSKLFSILVGVLKVYPAAKQRIARVASSPTTAMELYEGDNMKFMFPHSADGTFAHQ
eukprot:m.576586 g.576586  ORF g.576586 m.576586 type:complete len:240 (+) comp57900_c1_seq10:313-1032(+)